MTDEVAHHLLKMIDADCPSPFDSVSRLFSDEIYELSMKCIEIGRKREASFLLGTGGEMLPNSMLYNIYMITKAANDCRF